MADICPIGDELQLRLLVETPETSVFEPISGVPGGFLFNDRHFVSAELQKGRSYNLNVLADQVAYSARMSLDEMGGYPGVACRRRLPEGTGGFNLPSGRSGYFPRIVGRLCRCFHQRRQDPRSFFLPQFLPHPADSLQSAKLFFSS